MVIKAKKSVRERQGYGLAEFGVEWGYERGADENEKIYVADWDGVRYVDTEEQADALCRDNIARWSPC